MVVAKYTHKHTRYRWEGANNCAGKQWTEGTFFYAPSYSIYYSIAYSMGYV